MKMSSQDRNPKENGLRTWAAGIQPHMRVLGGFRPLEQVAFVHVGKNLGPYFRLKNICGHRMIHLSGTQMTRKDGVKNVFTKHPPNETGIPQRRLLAPLGK